MKTLKDIFTHGKHYLDAYDEAERLGLVPYEPCLVTAKNIAEEIVKELGGIVVKRVYPSNKEALNTIYFSK